MKDFCEVFYKDNGEKTAAESRFLSFSNEKRNSRFSIFLRLEASRAACFL